MIICIGILMVFLLSIVTRVFVRQILILQLGIENKFTSMVFFDDSDMATVENKTKTTYGETDDYSFNWKGEYPFEDNENETKSVGVTNSNFIDVYNSAVNEIKDRIEHYAQENLMGYSFFTELSNRVETLFGWNFTSYSEYNGIFQLPDGYWTSLKPKVDMTEHINSLNKLNKFCLSSDTNLMYVQAPFKISKYEDTNISGQLDFSNVNADELLKGIKNAGISFLDLRDNIHQENLNHHQLFYVTDHHWKAETGLWAAEKICEYINTKYDYEIDTTLLDSDNFIYDVYEDLFLGSYGKKVTLGKAEPEDFTLLYPKYSTQFHYVIPSIDIDTVGDFSVTYNMEAVVPKDYYNKSPYAAYNYGDRAVIRIENLDANVPAKKVLVIHDSFADAVIPFMALGIKSIESIDLRYFTGSLENYIDTSKPDLVIVMYNAGEVSENVEYTTHTDLFDFR